MFFWSQRFMSCATYCVVPPRLGPRLFAGQAFERMFVVVFFEQNLRMIPSPLDTYLLILAILDLRDVSRCASLLGAACAMLALAF